VFLVLALAILAIVVAATVLFGYAGLIVCLLGAVALAFVVLLALTADGLFPQKRGAGH
jgi:hypothetical protein